MHVTIIKPQEIFAKQYITTVAKFEINQDRILEKKFKFFTGRLKNKQMNKKKKAKKNFKKGKGGIIYGTNRKQIIKCQP